MTGVQTCALPILNALVENAEYSILSVDKHHTILLINSKLCDILFALTGIVVETGFNLLDILPENFHAEYTDLHKRALQGESFVHDRNVVMHGKRVDIEIVVTPVKDDFTNVMSVSLFGHDITDRKKSEQQLIQGNYTIQWCSDLVTHCSEET